MEVTTPTSFNRMMRTMVLMLLALKIYEEDGDNELMKLEFVLLPKLLTLLTLLLYALVHLPCHQMRYSLLALETLHPRKEPTLVSNYLRLLHSLVLLVLLVVDDI